MGANSIPNCYAIGGRIRPGTYLKFGKLLPDACGPFYSRSAPCQNKIYRVIDPEDDDKIVSLIDHDGDHACANLGSFAEVYRICIVKDNTN